MPRIYTVTLPATAIAAPMDIFQIKGAAGKTLKIKRLQLIDVDTVLPTAQMLDLRGLFLPATVTDGSAGGTSTPAKADPGDAAASFTCLNANTSKATTNGTAVTVAVPGCHIDAGLDHVFTAGVTENHAESC